MLGEQQLLVLQIYEICPTVRNAEKVGGRVRGGVTGLGGACDYSSTTRSLVKSRQF